VSSDRSKPSGAFGKAGLHTVGFDPADDHPRPEGTSFSHYARVHDRDAFRNRLLGAVSIPPTTQALGPAR
jgi:hypothetical protein